MARNTNKNVSTEKDVESTQDSVAVEETKTVAKKQKTKKPVIKDDDEVCVKSNVYGTLVFQDKKTGDMFEWDSEVDEQFMSVKHLKNMKSQAPVWFTENWISLVRIENDNVEHVSELYKYLGVDRYYKNVGIEVDFKEAIKKSPNELEQYIKGLSQTLQTSFVAFVIDSIENGTLDSIVRKKKIEEVLGVKFD